MSEDNTKKKSRAKRSRRRFDLEQSKSTVFIPAEGTVLSDRYKIIHEIGRGGMGVVYEAVDQHLETPVAIKLLPPELTGSKRAVKNLKREAVLAMKLHHPGIMALYNFEDSADAKYLVMELLTGETLDDRLADEETIPAEELIPITKALAEALNYAHNENIVHRDIKPNNIFLNEKNGKKVPTIMDFGIARQIKDSMSKLTNQESAGTLHYMSPEQLQGKKVDNRADLYSLAATIYECACGNPPFHSGAISYQITSADAKPIDDLPDEFNNALLKALSKNPDDRYSTTIEFARALGGEGLDSIPDGHKKQNEYNENSENNKNSEKNNNLNEYEDDELSWLDDMAQNKSVTKEKPTDKSESETKKNEEDEFSGYEALVAAPLITADKITADKITADKVKEQAAADKQSHKRKLAEAEITSDANTNKEQQIQIIEVQADDEQTLTINNVTTQTSANNSNIKEQQTTGNTTKQIPENNNDKKQPQPTSDKHEQTKKNKDKQNIQNQRDKTNSKVILPEQKGIIGQAASCLFSSIKIVLGILFILIIIGLAADELIEDEPLVNPVFKYNKKYINDINSTANSTNNNYSQQTNTNNGNTQGTTQNIYKFPKFSTNTTNVNQTNNNNNDTNGYSGKHQSGAMDPYQSQDNSYHSPQQVKGSGVLYQPPSNNTVFTSSPEDRARKQMEEAMNAADSGNSALALNYIRRLKDDYPSHIGEALPVICLLVDKNMLEEAKDALLLMPDNLSDPGLWLKIGEQSYARNKSELAAKALSKAIQHDPDCGRAYYFKAKLCRDYDKAKAILFVKKAVALEPENLDYRILAKALNAHQRKQPDNAFTKRWGSLLGKPGNRTAKKLNGAFNLTLNISKDFNVHVKEVFVTLTPNDGRMTSEGLNMVPAKLVQHSKSSTMRSYIIKRPLPVGSYNMEVSIEAINKLFGLPQPLTPGYHNCGSLTIRPGRGYSKTINLPAPKAETTYE